MVTISTDTRDLARLAGQLGILPMREDSVESRLLRRRPALVFKHDEQEVALSLTPAPKLRGEIIFGIGSGGIGDAVMQVPPAALRTFHVDLPAAHVLAGETPLARALQIELALAGLFAPLETATGEIFQVRESLPGPLAHQIGLRFSGPDFAFSCGLGLDDRAAEWLEQVLERSCPAERPDLSSLPVSVTAWAGRQYLSETEIIGLVPGDVITLEPGPMLALAGADMAASLTITPEGMVLQSGFTPRPEPFAPQGLQAIDFLLGQGSMGLAAFSALQPGERLPLAMFGGEAVSLSWKGRILGRGEIIRLGDGLAIRVLQVQSVSADEGVGPR